MKFQISPWEQFAIAIAVTLLTAVAKGAVSLPMGIPPVVGEYANSWSNFLLQIYAPISAVLALYGSSKPGPLAPDDPPLVKAAIAEDAAQTAQKAAVAAEKKE